MRGDADGGCVDGTTLYAMPCREYPYVASEGSGGCEDYNTVARESWNRGP
jgi:hypothetical protein